MDDTPQTLFQQAAELIQRGLALLDRERAAPREGEQYGRWRNFGHAKTYSKLKALPARLLKQVEELDKRDAALHDVTLEEKGD